MTKFRLDILTAVTVLQIVCMAIANDLVAQERMILHEMPALPDKEGWAGMFAGVSKGRLFCMGGANFPGKRPWIGGKKKWYNHIYMLSEQGNWKKINDSMPFSCAYGVSVAYKDVIIVAGGCNEKEYFNKVTGYRWNGSKMEQIEYPDLPEPRANTAGTILNNILIIAGGSASASSDPVNSCFAIDLDDPQKGWVELDTIPGPPRILSTSAAYDDHFYLFSGQHTATSITGESYSHILADAYRLTIKRDGSNLTGSWTRLSPMPKGVSGIGNPLPVLDNGKMLFWGGVDAVTNLHEDPSTFPGISGVMLLYDAKSDTWKYSGEEKRVPARVTLPVVSWKGQWVFISGEVKSGIRTNTVYSVKF